MNFVDVVAAATAAGDGGGVENLSDADVSGSREGRRRRNGGGGSEEEESNHGEHDATIINNAGPNKKVSMIPVPPPMPVPPAFFELERPIVQSIREFSNNNGTKRTENINLNWCKLWPPPEAVKMSSEQAKARHLVLNEIKALQLRRQTSFKRILKLPIWGSGKN
jgi:hypothetical protein